MWKIGKIDTLRDSLSLDDNRISAKINIKWCRWAATATRWLDLTSRSPCVSYNQLCAVFSCTSSETDGRIYLKIGDSTMRPTDIAMRLVNM